MVSPILQLNPDFQRRHYALKDSVKRGVEMLPIAADYQVGFPCKGDLFRAGYLFQGSA